MEKNGYPLIQDSSRNKGSAFTKEERQKFRLRGLLPYCSSAMSIQKKRVLENLRRKAFDIEKYIFLSGLRDRNERLFYRTVMDNLEEIMPLIYTPTVGQACKDFGHIFRYPKGFYITPEDKGDIREILDNWPEDDVRVIVVTDGQRILGLGDLGANGMGIAIGKLSLYVACAGIHPEHCLPVMLDVGTNNEELLNDPLYLGYPHNRIDQKTYLEIVDEFVTAVQEKFPKALIQFEDFLTPNAYALLNHYRSKVLCFNDDIQGTAAVALAGVYASTRASGVPFKDLRIMFLGAGSAATGIGDLMVDAFVEEGLTPEDAAKRLWFVDQHGLVVKSRTDLMSHNLPYAHDHEPLSFVEAIKQLKPHVLIGATGVAGTFTKEVVEAMSAINERPAVFALSNPTSNAECTAEQAFEWSKGKVLFTSGSPFKSVTYGGKTYRLGQGNNAYIFPGVGLAALSVQAKEINNPMFLSAAHALADQVTEDDLESGALYPPLTNIREVSLNIAVSVAEKAFEYNLSTIERPADLKAYIASTMYDPRY